MTAHHEHEGRDAAAASPESSTTSFDRRSFLKGAGGAAAGSVLASGLARARGARTSVPRVEGELEIELHVNGEALTVRVEPRTTLLGALRERCDPPRTGTKLVCDHASCGACTVLLDGEPRNACTTLALDAVGSRIRTVEGLAQNGELSALQEAFCQHDALMCGFCTPGFLMSLTGLLEKRPDADDDAIRAACSGNLCRCGTYPFVLEAARQAGARLQGREALDGGEGTRR